MKNTPVVIAMDWYSDMEVIDGIMYTDQNEKDIIGGHCMVLYGWNEIGWKIQNSWGAEWGNEGRFILPYHIDIREAWGITDEVSHRTKIEQLENSNTELKSTISELNSELKTIKSEQLERITELLRLQGENSSLSFEALSNKQTIERLERTNTKLSEQVDEYTKQVNALLENVETLTNDKKAAEEALVSGISKLNETINAMREQIENQKAEIEYT